MQLLSASWSGDCKVQEIWDSTCVISVLIGVSRTTLEKKNIVAISGPVYFETEINMEALPKVIIAPRYGKCSYGSHVLDQMVGYDTSIVAGNPLHCDTLSIVTLNWE